MYDQRADGFRIKEVQSGIKKKNLIFARCERIQFFLQMEMHFRQPDKETHTISHKYLDPTSCNLIATTRLCTSTLSFLQSLTTYYTSQFVLVGSHTHQCSDNQGKMENLMDRNTTRMHWILF